MFLKRCIIHVLIFGIRFIRPGLLGPAICLYSPSCADFACQQLQEKSLSTALLIIIKRLISCNSFITCLLKLRVWYYQFK